MYRTNRHKIADIISFHQNPHSQHIVLHYKIIERKEEILPLLPWCKFTTPKAELKFLLTNVGRTLFDGSEDELAVRIWGIREVVVLIQGSDPFAEKCRALVNDALIRPKVMEIIPSQGGRQMPRD